MRPDASRLVYRIKTALKGESNGLDTANLAWQYAAEVERASQRLSRCLQEKDDLEAYLESNRNPSVLESLDTLDFANADEWKRRCELLGYRVADGIDREGIKRLRERFAEKEDLKGWLEGEFRRLSRAKRPIDAFRIAKLLAEEFESDENVQSERQRLEEQVVAQAEAEIKSASEELMPDRSPDAALDSYESAGVDLPAREGPLKSAIEARQETRLSATRSAIEALVKKADSAKGDEALAALEAEYLALDYRLTMEDTRGQLSQEERDALGSISTKLSRQRGNLESNILIRAAIKDLHDILQGVSISFGNRKATAHDAYERLASLQMQAKKMGRRIPYDLQEEIKKARSLAKRKRAPKYAILGVAAVAALTLVSWIVFTQLERNREASSWQEAAAALGKARSSQNIESAQSALVDWNAIIETAPPEHALTATAQSLRDWIAEQKDLQSGYAEVADKLDALRGVANPDPNSSLIDPLLESAATIEASLGERADPTIARRIAQFQAWRGDRLAQIDNARKRTLLDHVSAAQDSLEQAAAASNARDFETHSTSLVNSIGEARTLIASHPELDANSLHSRSLGRLEGALEGLRQKRDSMEVAQKSIKDAKDIASYLSSLEAIYNYETLAPESKRAIGRILKLENEYETLLQYLVMPNDRDGWIELGSSDDYATERIDPDEEERAHLERLIGNLLFPAVYESSVKYFEGEPVAKSEYSVFLVDPIQKGDTAGLKTGLNFSFKARGFDENGEAEPDTREMNFLSHPDGSFWGFFYEPSTLSRESLYFQETIRLTLLRILNGAPRFALLDLLQTLSDERSLAPAYRAYWQQELISLAQLDPWKWGSALAPSVNEMSKTLETIGPDGLEERLWLSSVEQISPSIEFNEYFRMASKRSLLDEARAFSSLYRFATQGSIALVGQADSSGKIEYNSDRQAEDKLWIVNGLTGRIETLEEGLAIAPFAPVVTYRFEGKPASRLLQKTRAETGIDLSAPEFEGKLPSILK